MSIILINAIWIIGVILGVIAVIWGVVTENAGGLIGGLLIGATGIVMASILYFNTTAAGEQRKQSWKAQSNGIYREIKIYSMTGEVIDQYKGVVNIEYSNDGDSVNIYDVKTQTRKIIYYKNGTVIVTEGENK